jgi:sugar phosphate isomerase/epimerase
MKLAFSTNAFKKYSLESAIMTIAGIGYEGLEILCDIPHLYPPNFMEGNQIKIIKNLLSKCNLQISNLNAFTLYGINDVYHPSWIEEDKELRLLRIKHTIDCIHIAKEIGAKSISTEPGGPIESICSLNDNRKRLQTLFVEGLKMAAQVAEQNGISILVEPEPNLLIENSRQFLDIIKTVDSKSVKLNFDIGHFYCVREDPARLIYELSDYIEHFHLADISKERVHNHLIPGNGSIDFHSVFKAINGIGYKGFVTVELYPYQENPQTVAKTAYEYLKGIIMQT